VATATRPEEAAKVARSKWLKVRVDDGEIAEVKETAAQAGLSVSDLARERLGLTASRPAAPAPVAPGIPTGGDSPEPDDPAIEAEAKRIYNRDGVPMRLARQRAREQLAGA
jgi:hypothetical protein